MKIRSEIILLISAWLFAVAAIVACNLWGVESDPWAACAVDAPMETAHCRAMEVTP